jgi:hypothetical protein
MIEVRLPMEDWQRVLAHLAQAPWAQVNPLIMAIGEQLRAGAEMAAKRDAPVRRGNGADLEAALEGRSE